MTTNQLVVLPQNGLGIPLDTPSICISFSNLILDKLQVVVEKLREENPSITLRVRYAISDFVNHARKNKKFLSSLSNPKTVVAFNGELSTKLITVGGEEVIGKISVKVGNYPMTIDVLSAHPANLLYNTVITADLSFNHIEAETRAHGLLKSILDSDELYNMYLLHGCIIHRSSDTIYVIRKGFPTLVFKAVDVEGVEHVKFVGGLCAHIEATAQGMFAGSHCQTDDVIAHLLLLRSNETAFWEQANFHLPISGRLGV